MFRPIRISWSIGNLWVPGKRESAIRTLTGIGSPVVKPLFKACRNSYSRNNYWELWLSVRTIFAAVRAGEQLATLLRTCRDNVSKQLLCQQLGYLADASTTEALIEALRDTCWEVRMYAAQALGLLGDCRAVPPLLAVLNDNDCHVRRDAALSLGRLRDNRAVEPMVNMLNAGVAQSEVTYSVARALGLLGDQQAVEPLVNRLKALADDKQFCREAITSLGLLHAGSARHYFIEGLRDRETCGASAEALGCLGDIFALDPLLAELKVAENDPLFYPKWGMTDTGHLVKALFVLSPEQVLPVIFDALGSVNSTVALSVLCELRKLVNEGRLSLDILVAGSERRSSRVRDGVASVLRGVDHPGAVAALETLNKQREPKSAAGRQQQEATCEGAIASLLAVVRDHLKTISDDDVQREYRTLVNAWGSEKLFTGTLDELQPILAANLDRISREEGFRYFLVYHAEMDGNAGVMASFPQSMVPVRIWKTGTAVCLCGNRLFHGV